MALRCYAESGQASIDLAPRRSETGVLGNAAGVGKTPEPIGALLFDDPLDGGLPRLLERIGLLFVVAGVGVRQFDMGLLEEPQAALDGVCRLKSVVDRPGDNFDFCPASGGSEGPLQNSSIGRWLSATLGWRGP